MHAIVLIGLLAAVEVVIVAAGKGYSNTWF
jgi:hypothetical protein